MLSYNEKSGVELQASFFDADGIPTIPQSVQYRVDCATTQRALLDWSSASVQSETTSAGEAKYFVVIEVPGSLNVIQSNRNRQEVKTVLIVANKDQDAEFSQEYQYVVRNLQGRN